ncbi:hypothetical protein JZ751_023915 [Albula glossodonta]|uniref:Uncharacterized protein n=1 Tax=Albula glossodonta TaxID=121402 RepID=A0A8T2NIW9_9TELE|nr:hypothetical protein JZ751_023915 [Albula glossodonta]
MSLRTAEQHLPASEETQSHVDIAGRMNPTQRVFDVLTGEPAHLPSGGDGRMFRREATVPISPKLSHVAGRNRECLTLMNLHRGGCR